MRPFINGRSAMKNWLLVLFIIVITSTSASASYLSIGFAGTSEKAINASPGSTFDVNVYIYMGESSSDIITGVSFGNTEEPMLSQIGTSVELANWVTDEVNGPLGTNRFVVETVTSPVTDVPGTRILLGVQKIRVNPNAVPGSVLLVMFNHFNDISIASDTGLLTYNRAYGDYAGYWAFGTGDPGNFYGPPTAIVPKDPLAIQVVPEPASLALLVLGGAGPDPLQIE